MASSIPFRSFLSPIDDYSNIPFRLLCQKYGAEATCVPLVNSTAIFNNPDKDLDSLFDSHKDEKNLGVQIVGNDSKVLAFAASRIADALSYVKYLNINCGCPSVRTRNSGGGSALLDEPEKIVSAVELIKQNISKPISVKIRIKKNEEETIKLATQIEKAGADFLIIHGRTAGMGYSGQANWNLIKAVKESISIPLIGNGDLKNAQEGNWRIENGFCDGYMIARSAMANPGIFSNQTIAASKLLSEYIELHKKYLGEPMLKDLKLKSINFVNGTFGAANLRNQICKCLDVSSIQNFFC